MFPPGGALCSTERRANYVFWSNYWANYVGCRALGVYAANLFSQFSSAYYSTCPLNLKKVTAPRHRRKSDRRARFLLYCKAVKSKEMGLLFKL